MNASTAREPTDRFEWETVRTLDELELDPENPRLPPRYRGATQQELLEVLSGRFDVEGLAEAIVEAGFLAQDPIAGYESSGRIRVREGNRRVAAIKLLLDPGLAPERYRSRFERLSAELPSETRDHIAELQVQVWHDPADSQLIAYIGYRHVTGIKSWPAVEKASFMAHLVAWGGLSFEDVAGRLGTKARAVERHVVAHQLIEQAFGLDLAGAKQAEETFGVLLRALQEAGIPEFLGVVFDGSPDRASSGPVPPSHLQELSDFLRWTFGTEESDKILTDSHHLPQWADILNSEESLDYLRRTANPSFDRAWEHSGGEATTLVNNLRNSADLLRDAVPIIADHNDDDDVQAALVETVRFYRRLAQQVPGLVEGADSL